MRVGMFYVFLLTLIPATSLPLFAEDWAQFRGPNASGVSSESDNLPVKFSIDEKVMLSFTLPDADKIVNCSAKVAWANLKEEPKKPDLPAGIGLQFLDLSTEYLLSIQSLLKHDGVESISEPEK